MARFGQYCEWYKCKDGTIELPIMGLKETYTDLFQDEKELCVVEWGDEIPQLININEIITMLNNNTVYRHQNITENCIEVTFNGDIIYIICPLKADKKVKQWFNNIKIKLKGDNYVD